MNLINKLLLFLIFISTPVLTLGNEQKLAEESKAPKTEQQSNEMTAAEIAKVEKIETQIKRIEEKLKTEPKVEGWVLVGDANMHLKKYDAAARAYKEAYILSEYSPETRKKLKNALYHVQSGVEEIK